jgi:hypothetical protein
MQKNSKIEKDAEQPHAPIEMAENGGQIEAALRLRSAYVRKKVEIKVEGGNGSQYQEP